MKYYIYRQSKYTGRVEVLRTKTSDIWCGEEYLKKYPDRVWMFSKSGANGIVKRHISNGWHFKYWIVPVEEARK